MLLSCMFELREYALHHRLCPTKAAALLATDDGRVIKQLMDELQEEWELILKMETQLETKLLLHSKCLYVGYQQTREVLSSLAQSNYNLTPSVRSLLLAWHPQIQSSANLESIFGDLSSAIKRTGRSETASLPNMMAVGVRALHHRFQSEDEAGEPIHLDSGDWEGETLVPQFSYPLYLDLSLPESHSINPPLSLHACCNRTMQHTHTHTRIEAAKLTLTFPSTTAYLHSHSALNSFLAFLLCHRPLELITACQPQSVSVETWFTKGVEESSRRVSTVVGCRMHAAGHDIQKQPWVLRLHGPKSVRCPCHSVIV